VLYIFLKIHSFTFR